VYDFALWPDGSISLSTALQREYGVCCAHATPSELL
jgi:hypothetical protein